MNEITTELTRLDLKFIKDNYLKVENWGKNWTIYKHNGIEIAACLYSIDIVCGNKICIKLDNIGTSYAYTKAINIGLNNFMSAQFVNVPINNPEYTEELFEYNILKKTLEIIKNIEHEIIISRESSVFKINQKEEKLLEVIASNYLDSRSIVNEEVRKTYTKNYVDKNRHRYNVKYVENLEYHIISNEYLNVVTQFNNAQVYKDISNKVHSKIEVINWNEIENYVGSKEFHIEMVNNLELI